MYANLAHVVSTWCGDGLIDQLLAHDAAECILHARQEASLRRPHTHTDSQSICQYCTVQSTRGGGGGRLEWLTVLMVAMRSDQVFLLLASALMLLLCSRDSW